MPTMRPTRRPAASASAFASSRATAIAAGIARIRATRTARSIVAFVRRAGATTRACHEAVATTVSTAGSAGWAGGGPPVAKARPAAVTTAAPAAASVTCERSMHELRAAGPRRSRGRLRVKRGEAVGLVAQLALRRGVELLERLQLDLAVAVLPRSGDRAVDEEDGVGVRIAHVE